MKPLTIVTIYTPFIEKNLLPLTKSGLVERVVMVSAEPVHLKIPKCQVLVTGPLPSHTTLSLILSGVGTQYLLILLKIQQISIEPNALRKILDVIESTKAGLVYSDFYDINKREKILHPLNDYQLGTVCDDFDFGTMILFSVPAVQKALKKYGQILGVQHAGLYDLRLKLSIDHAFYHLQEPLYSMMGTDVASNSSKKIFGYVDPLNEAVQKEMETVFANYLMKIGAYLPSSHLANFREVKQTSKFFPVEASIIIPVRNRKVTIAEAVKSGLSQESNFPYNVIVVDNHSTDGTTEILSNLARQHPDLKIIVPMRTDLGIGGCWNEALHSKVCGRFAVQLDSDDLYSDTHTLQKMVDMIRQGNYAMVIGSYTIVNSSLEEIPPGLINHREWTEENGHNNALRINGLGAPRAFNTGLMRKIGFLNVSYGEDYAAALRICRQYRIGRIFESLYLCRRWSGNTDAALTIEETNRNNAFKDKIRTDEILARQKINQNRF